MKKKSIFIISVGVILGLLMTPSVFAAKKLNPTPDKPLTLKMATFFSSEKDIRQIYTRKWGEGITKATNGAIKFRYFPGGQLVKAKEMSDALKMGIIDANTWFVTAYTPEDYPFLSAIFLIPLALPDTLETFMAFSNDKAVQEAMFKPLETHNIKRLWGMEASYGQEWFFKEPWDPKDPAANFKGKRVRSPGILAARIFLNWLGAEQISMSAPEAYEAGQKGIIQGCTLGFSQFTHSHTYEVFPNVMFANTTFNAPGGVSCVFRLNLWNQLPENMQAAIEKVSQEIQAAFFNDYRKEVDRLKEKLIKEGKIKQFVTLDPNTKAGWVKEFNQVLDKGMVKKFPERWPKFRDLVMKYQ